MLPIRRYKTAKIDLDKKTLIRLYKTEKLSTIEISKKLGISKKTVIRKMIQYGIERLSLKDAFARSKTHAKNNTKREHESPSWRGGRKKDMGYIRVMARWHHEANADGYSWEHRIIAEKKIGRLLNKNEQVHHINGIKDDNRPENLIVMTQSEHMSMHMKERQAKKWGKK